MFKTPSYRVAVWQQAYYIGAKGVFFGVGSAIPETFKILTIDTKKDTKLYSGGNKILIKNKI